MHLYQADGTEGGGLCDMQEQRENFANNVLTLLGVSTGGHLSMLELRQSISACSSWACQCKDASGFAAALAAGLTPKVLFMLDIHVCMLSK